MAAPADWPRMEPRTVTVNDRMQHGYAYVLSEPEGQNFSPEFTPDLTPAEMLELGVFGGKYMTDAAGGCRGRTIARSSAGAPCAGMWHRSGGAAMRATSSAVHASGRPSCSGPMTAGSFDGTWPGGAPTA